jgi:hypothetical protein
MDLQYRLSVLLLVNFTTHSHEKRSVVFLLRFLILIIEQFSDFVPTVSNKEPSTSKSRTGLIVGIVVAVIASGLLVMLTVLVLRYKIKKKEIEEGIIIHVS